MKTLRLKRIFVSFLLAIFIAIALLPQASYAGFFSAPSIGATGGDSPSIVPGGGGGESASGSSGGGSSGSGGTSAFKKAVCASLFQLTQYEVPTQDIKQRALKQEDCEKEKIGDKIGWLFANAALQSVTGSIVNWINSGFQGSPAFVQDLKGHFQNLGNVVFEDYITELGVRDILCTSFKARIQRTLQLQLAISQGGGRFGKEASFRKKASCTVDTVLKNLDTTAEGFAQDFNKGGWSAWLYLSQPQNNQFGAYLNVQEELWRRTQEAQENQAKELNYGQGFLSWKKCTEYGTGPDVQGPPSKDEGGNLVPPSGCLKEEIFTPGKVIEQQLNKSLGLGEDKLVVADEINEVISALMGQLVQKVFAGGLFGASQAGSSGQSYTQALSNDSSNADGVRSTIIDILNGMLVSIDQYEAALRAEVTRLNQSVALLDQLITCLSKPGSITGSELSRAQNKKAELSARIQTLNQKIATVPGMRSDVTNYKNTVLTASSNQISTLATNFYNNVDTSYYADLTAAASHDLSQLRSELTTLDGQTQSSLNTCRGQ